MLSSKSPRKLTSHQNDQQKNKGQIPFKVVIKENK